MTHIYSSINFPHLYLFQGVCTFVGTMLSYMYLVVFCLLLSEAIELMVAVLLNFDTKPRINTLIVLSWRKYDNIMLFFFKSKLTPTEYFLYCRLLSKGFPKLSTILLLFNTFVSISLCEFIVNLLLLLATSCIGSTNSTTTLS